MHVHDIYGCLGSSARFTEWAGPEDVLIVRTRNFGAIVWPHHSFMKSFWCS